MNFLHLVSEIFGVYGRYVTHCAFKGSSWNGLEGDKIVMFGTTKVVASLSSS